MASLNEIAEHIAVSFDVQNNEIFKDSIKFRIKQLASLLMEREQEQYGTSMFYLQSYEAELEQVDANDSCLESVPDSDCVILKTKNPVPTPIKTKTGNPFLFVGNATKDVIFAYGKKEHVKFMSYLKFAGKAYYYEYINNYIYVYNATKIKTIRIDAKYDKTILDYCDDASSECVTDDMEFPCSAGIMAQVIDIIIKGGLAAIVKDANVEINDEKANARTK